MDGLYAMTGTETQSPDPHSAPCTIARMAMTVLLSGAAAVYGIAGGHGNAFAASCEMSAPTREAINQAARGDVAAFFAANAAVDISSLAFKDGDGKDVTLADKVGTTVLLNLWATWCAPCRHEMPALDALQKNRGGDDFEVVAVSVDLGDDTKPKAFFAETGIASMQFYHDGTMGVFNGLKKQSLAFGMPTTLLVDRQGCVLGVLNGPADWSGADALGLVEAGVKAE